MFYVFLLLSLHIHAPNFLTNQNTPFDSNLSSRYAIHFSHIKQKDHVSSYSDLMQTPMQNFSDS
jgi:hypothetical protein